MQKKETCHVGFHRGKKSHFLYIIKGEHTFIFEYAPNQYELLLRKTFESAINPDLMGMCLGEATMLLLMIDECFQQIQRVEETLKKPRAK